MSQVAHQVGTYSGFSNMYQLGVFLLPPSFGAFSTKFTFNQNTNALYPRSPSDKRSRASVMINRGDL